MYTSVPLNLLPCLRKLIFVLPVGETDNDCMLDFLILCWNNVTCFNVVSVYCDFLVMEEGRYLGLR